MLILKIILLIVLFSMFYQDVTERRVYWFLFPTLAICSGILFYNNTLSEELFYIYVIINSILVFILLLVAFLYTKFKLKIRFSEALGLGDILLFIVLIFSFSSISFLVIFVFSLIFSLVLHLFVKNHAKYTTVPLAGYMSLFFAFAYLSYWLNITSSLYTL